MNDTVSMAFRHTGAALAVIIPDRQSTNGKATMTTAFPEKETFEMTDHTKPKRCTGCGEVKDAQEFYLRSTAKPDGPRRSRCKACMVAADLRRYHRGPSIISQIARHAYDPDAPLSPEAEAAIYTTEPLDPELVRQYKLREKADAKKARRQQRIREREMGMRPMRFARIAA